ncbi:MAG: RnfABCDGE type electron transport complex subunit D [Treponema sp.]|jgi:electron transport complex protein RnfD|nr:RnfABCDGE type electron transport complex subunit D [Treponema sp.]
MAENIIPAGKEAPKQASYFLSSRPHIASPVSARTLMARVLIALAPAAIYGVVLFGLSALLTIVISILAAELGEAFFRTLTRQELRNRDLSAAVTGLLLALIIPPGVPLWMTALGAFFAVIVAKEFFGGLGANVFNPALTGRAFLIMSFPAALTTWRLPGPFSPDAVSSATPLGILKLGGTAAELGADFAGAGLSASSGYWGVIKTLCLGNHGGCIGETSIPLILAGMVFLLFTKTIDWRAPLTMMGSVFVFSFIFGRDPLVGILSGGVVFGAVFMATDYVSAPLTAGGKLIFGFGAGLITVLIRRWGNYPEGVTYGLLIMNAATPFLNKLMQKKYGHVHPAKGIAPASAAPAAFSAPVAPRVQRTEAGKKPEGVDK